MPVRGTQDLAAGPPYPATDIPERSIPESRSPARPAGLPQRPPTLPGPRTPSVPSARGCSPEQFGPCSFRYPAWAPRLHGAFRFSDCLPGPNAKAHLLRRQAYLNQDNKQTSPRSGARSQLLTDGDRSRGELRVFAGGSAVVRVGG